MGGSHEALIVGAGPAGLTAGIYLMRAGINTVLIEQGVVGGTPMKYEHVDNYPGFPEGIGSRELMERMTSQARRFGLAIKDFCQVTEITHSRDKFVTRAGEEIFESLGVIVAVGTQSMPINVPGEEKFVGRGVSSCATCDGMFFRDLDVAVIGGGDAAIQEGLTLANLARKVYVIHRRDTLRAQKIIQEHAFKNPKMEFLWNKVPVEIKGTEQVERIKLRDTRTEEFSELAVDGVFVYVGSRPDTRFLGDLVQKDEAGFIMTDESLLAKTQGLYVAGDARRKLLRQISTAVGDGALAAVSLEHYILGTR